MPTTLAHGAEGEARPDLETKATGVPELTAQETYAILSSQQYRTH